MKKRRLQDAEKEILIGRVIKFQFTLSMTGYEIISQRKVFVKNVVVMLEQIGQIKTTNIAVIEKTGKSFAGVAIFYTIKKLLDFYFIQKL